MKNQNSKNVASEEHDESHLENHGELGKKFANISKFFASKFRISLLLFLAVILLGTLSYTNFLKREGFPSVEIPIAIIQTPYFVDNATLIDEQITSLIVNELADVTEISKVTSNSTDNFSVVVVEFSEGTSSAEGAELIKDDLTNLINLPENAKPEVSTINASQFNGEYDMIISLSNDDKSVQELQTKADEIAEELKSVGVIANAETIRLLEVETNPVTDESFENLSGFNRVGFKDENGNLLIKNAISIGIVKKGEATDTLSLSKAVHDKVDLLEEEGAFAGYDVHYTGDFAITLEQNFESLEENAIGGLLAVLLVLFIMVSWRASIVTALFIPLVLAAVFITLYLLGLSLNVITLFALILVLGLFVDDATVVVEAIDYQKRKGLKGLNAIKTAVTEVAIPDIAGTMMVILVFAPLLFVSGVLGAFIVQIPITVILAMALSLVFALTLIPFLCNLIITDKSEKEPTTILGWTVYYFTNGTEIVVHKLANGLANFVNFYLSRKIFAVLTIIFAFVLIGIGASYAGKLVFSIFPNPKDANEMLVQVTYPFGLEVEEASQKAEEIEKIIVETEKEYITDVVYQAADQGGATILITLTDLNKRDKTAVQISDELNDKFSLYEDAEVKAGLSSVGPPASEYQFTMQIYANNQETLERGSKAVEEFIANRTIDEASNAKVVETKIDNLEIVSKNNNRRYAEVKAKLSESENTGLILQLQEQIENEFTEEKLSELGLADDALGFDLGQESENLESFNSTIFALGAALILMYILLVVQFNSFSQPLLIFLAIPLTFPGLFPGLYLTDNPFSFFVMLGIIGLTGIVVNNTIMLVTFANQGIADGLSIKEATVNAVRRRFRAIITTSLTTIAGLLPLALTDPFWEGLAFSIVFGLISSSILVLTLFPSFYYFVESGRRWFHKLPGRVRGRLFRA